MSNERKNKEKFTKEMLTGAIHALNVLEQSGTQNQILWAHFSVLNSYIKVAVKIFLCKEEAIHYLNNSDFKHYLEEYYKLNEKTYRQFYRKRVHPETQVCNAVETVHYPWLLNEFDIAKNLLEICSDENVWKYDPQTKFWGEYIRKLKSLESNGGYNPVIPKLRGYEKYWVPYIDLMVNLERNTEISESTHKINESFYKRNNDKKVVDYAFNGDGNDPVNWDLRKETLLIFAKHKNG